jgi:hypothetical protein
MQRDPRSSFNVRDHIGWGAIQTDLPLLVQHYAQLLHQLNQETS